MSATLSIGVDPGKSGAIGFISDSMGVWAVKNRETLHDLAIELRHAVNGHDRAFAVIEKVGATPQMGVTSAFTFGRSFGELLGILSALGVPFEMVSPQKWQKGLACLSRGNKNVTKARAQQLFPDLKITHAIADSLLLAEFCRRNFT